MPSAGRNTNTNKKHRLVISVALIKLERQFFIMAAVAVCLSMALLGFWVERLLRQHDFPAEQLEIEVSEDIVMADVDRTVDVLRRRLGVRRSTTGEA